eukprot:scaffold57333_cov33-Attheya_sp.AAC.1
MCTVVTSDSSIAFYEESLLSSQKANKKSKKKEEQTKESGPSLDLNICLGPKLDPNCPPYTPS